MKIMSKKIVALFMGLIIGLIPVNVFAATPPYKDVNTKVLDRKSVKSIARLKKNGAFKGVIKGKKFRPMKKFTRRQFLAILENLYPGKVLVNASDVKKAKKKVTKKYVSKKLVGVAKAYGIKISFTVYGKKKPSRATVSNSLITFSKLDPAFKLKS